MSLTCFSFNNFNLDNKGKPAPIGEMHFSPVLMPDVSPMSYKKVNIEN